MHDFERPAPPDSSFGCGRHLLYIGCTGTVAVIAFFVLGLIFIWKAFFPADPPSGWETHLLPPKIKTSRVLHKAFWAIWRDSCTYVAYEIAPPTRAAIEKQGVAFFADAGPISTHRDGNSFTKWRETPVMNPAPDGSSIFATGALDGCAQSEIKLPEMLYQLRSRKDRSGSYYTVTRNGHDMILVLPEEGIVLLLHST